MRLGDDESKVGADTVVSSGSFGFIARDYFFWLNFAIPDVLPPLLLLSKTLPEIAPPDELSIKLAAFGLPPTSSYYVTT